MTSRLEFDIGCQPDFFTCGPTCLHAVYRFFDCELPLEEVIANTPRLENGGTLAVLLACDALRRGFQATIYTWNLQIFDPTWFRERADQLPDKLRRQMQLKGGERLQGATASYLEFLELGGEVRMINLSEGLLQSYLQQGIPILSGLSSTYLYAEPREFGPDSQPDPLRGTPQGHFVVLCGYDPRRRTVLVADPLQPNPLGKLQQRYEVDLERVMCAIMLGVLTYDANMLILRPGTDNSLSENPTG